VTATTPTVTRPGSPPRADDRLSPLFWRLWCTAACFYLSEGIRLAAFPLLAAAFTRSPFDVSLVSGVQSLAWLIFGLQAGALVDRFAPTRTMLLAGVARAIVLGVVVIAVALRVHSVVMLVAGAFLVGTSSTLGDLAQLSVVPALVPRSALERATGRLVAAQVTFLEFFGPLVGSTVFALSRWLPVGVDFAMQVAGVACILTFVNAIPRTPRDDRARVNMRSEIASGIRWLADHRLVRIIALSGTLLAFADGAWMAVLVLYSERILRLASSEYGFLLAAGALGGLCGAAATERVAKRFSLRVTLIGSALLGTVPPLLLAIFRSPVLSGVLLAIASAGLACWNVISVSARQRHVPAELRGRLNALQRFGLFGGAGIGALAGGWLATATTITAPFVMAGPLGVFAIGLLLFGRTGRHACDGRVRTRARTSWPGCVARLVGGDRREPARRPAAARALAARDRADQGRAGRLSAHGRRPGAGRAAQPVPGLDGGPGHRSPGRHLRQVRPPARQEPGRRPQPAVLP
jgi:MFS family permease